VTDEPDAPQSDAEPPAAATSNFELMFAAPPRPQTHPGAQTHPAPGQAAPTPVFTSAVPTDAAPSITFDPPPATETPSIFEARPVFDGPPVFTATPAITSPPSVAAPTIDPGFAATPGSTPVHTVAPPSDGADGTRAPIPSGFAFERRTRERQRSTSLLDWIAFGLAFVAPPVGALAGVATVVISSRTRGWSSGVGKAAIGVGLSLSLVLAGAGVVISRNLSAQATNDALVASSVQWCSSLRSDPTRLASSTYGWPPIAGTIAQSLPAMQKYEDYWTSLAKIAPAGIKVETQKIATTAKGIITSVQTSRVLDDASNVATMQEAVSVSTIPAWVSGYCK
jgi:hypothetical protein